MAAILAKTGTVSFKNGIVFKEKRFYVTQWVCSREQNPIESYYNHTICASKAV